MIWPFKKKPDRLSEKLYFKSGVEFFEYQCEFGHTEIMVNQGIAALVLDARKEFGTSSAIKINADGTQLAVLRVASKEGGFVVLAKTPSEKGTRLNSRDVVIWVPSIYNPEIAKGLGDARTGWVGLIRARVKPEINSTGGFEISCMYD